MVTWPANEALLAKMVWLPTTQSCAKCTYAMIQLSLPKRVSPMPVTVPVLNVVNSRMVLLSPMMSLVGSPAYFLSCGCAPNEANWKILLFLPMLVWPSMTTCGPTSVPASMLTFGPMMENAPTLTPSASWAFGSTMAWGWMLVAAMAYPTTFLAHMISASAAT